MTVLAIARVTAEADGAVYHVHAEGCADLKRGRRYLRAEVESADYPDFESLVRDFYSGHISDAGDDNWRTYAPEFKVFPCATLEGAP